MAEHSGDPEEKIEKNIAHFDCIIYNQVAEHSGDPGGNNLEFVCSDRLWGTSYYLNNQVAEHNGNPEENYLDKKFVAVTGELAMKIVAFNKVLNTVTIMRMGSARIRWQ